MTEATILNRPRRPWANKGFLLAILTLITTLPSQTDAEDLRTAALTPGMEMLREVDLPVVLAPAEIARYQRIFAFEDKGAWGEADREIARLGDTLLLGHVLAERYLAKSYKASYAELAAWLDKYADEPDAKELYALALNRRPAHAPAPHRPIATALEEREPANDDEADPALPPQAALVARQIRSLAATAPRRAELLLAGPEARRLLDDETRASLRTFVAERYLAAGQPQQALVLSTPAQDGAESPVAHWDAGLAAWHLGRMSEAKEHFEALARNPGRSPTLKSAGAFWAARVAQRAHRPDHVAYWLGLAAEQPRTFYGLIARRMLGEDPQLDFEAEPFTRIDARALTSMEAGRRALALLAVGQRVRAAAELRPLAQSDRPAMLQSLAAVADRADLAALSLQVSATLTAADGRTHDRALFPVPHWTPRGGFTVDRALLFALMRQESLFVPRAASTAGAQGLMQLMPATARAMANRKGVHLAAQERDAEKALADPELNLTLAQEYVRVLLRHDRIKGNLILFALAYNGGPAVAKRVKDLPAEYRHDPLLYIESIVTPQLRLFTKHVLTNYWIYRMRLQQATPDLDALAAGKWPTYIALDQRPVQDGRYAANR
jgi:soluble lytic murein transglycosylase